MASSHLPLSFLCRYTILIAFLSITTTHLHSKVPEITRNGCKGGPDTNRTGRIFLLSVGIDDYSVIHESFRFKNCGRDAIHLAEVLATQNQRVLPERNGGGETNYYRTKDTDYLHCQVLINEQASKANILAALSKIIELAKPEDVFVFNFAGVSLVSPFEKDDHLFLTNEVANMPGLVKKNFQPEISFHTKECRSAACTGCRDRAIVEKDVRSCAIGLSTLKDLLELIPCKRQLFISEAGSSSDFTKCFVKKLVESEPSVASLLEKNRVFILPSLYGLDNCGSIQHGPINYVISQTDQILDVFEQPDKVYRQLISAEFRMSAECKIPAYGQGLYTTLFCEKKELKNMLELFPEVTNSSRGVIMEPLSEEIPRKVSGKHALLVATDHYQAHKDLLNPVRDALSIAKELNDIYGFETKVLIDSSADDILRNIVHYTRTLDSNAQLFIFFAGHGYFNERYFDEGYIVCKESKDPKQDPYLNSYLPFSKLEKMINKVPARQVFVMLDVCFGGTFNEQMSYCQTRTGPTSGRGPLYENLQVDEYISRKMQKNTRRFLTSGGKNEVPDGYGGKSSPFAIKFLEALRSKGGDDGVLTTVEIFSVLERIPSDPRMGSFGNDECGSDFFFIPRTK